MTTQLHIKPHAEPGPYRTGSLSGISTEGIEHALGFPANVDDDPKKVSHSWGFTVNGHVCGVWSYKGSELRGEFSTFGPADVMRALFGMHYSG